VSSPFVAEIRMFGFNFPPTGWAQCNGQLMPISQNTALFSLLGTMYGGDGKSTFALPDLQDNAAIFWGQGQGLSLYDQGQMGGASFITLLSTEMPIHNHNVMASSDPGNLKIAAPARSLARSQNANAYKAPANQPTVNMNFQELSIAGGSLPHNNMMPYLTVNYCIALQGVFPPRT
jgi:microcystin-dependent protein